MTPSALGLIIKAHRKRYKITQGNLAHNLKIDRALLSRIENGQVPSVNVAMALDMIFGGFFDDYKEVIKARIIARSVV